MCHGCINFVVRIIVDATKCNGILSSGCLLAVDSCCYYITSGLFTTHQVEGPSRLPFGGRSSSCVRGVLTLRPQTVHCCV